MPYKRIGRKVYVKRNTGWVKKQTCKSINNAKAALRILKSLEKKEGRHERMVI